MRVPILLALTASLSLLFFAPGNYNSNSVLAEAAKKSPAPASAADSAILSQVKAYELKYFERTFEGESCEKRLDRLENFIFGSTNSGATANRTAQIVAAVGLPAAPQVTASPKSKSESADLPPAGYSRGSYTDAGAQDLANQSPGNYPRVTALESEILGQTYATQALVTRLSRMELKVFGNPSHSDDLSARTDALDQYAQVKLHIKPQAALAVNPQMEGGKSGAAGNLGSPGGNPFVRGLRSIADGLGPVGSLGMAPGVPITPSSSYDDDDPAAEARRQMVQQQLVDAAKPNAPSAHERTLSRVAWCEMQMFGKSFPQMHLLQRLHQLNAELFPTDKEKDIQLMDRIDVIVREVVLRKHPAEAVAKT